MEVDTTKTAAAPTFFIQDEARDIPIITQAFARMYQLAFLMTGNEIAAEQLELETRVATAEALDRLHFAEFPEQRLFDRIVDAQFVYQCETFFDDAFGSLVAYGPWMNKLDTTPMPRVKTTTLQAAVLLLPATERLIYLLCHALGYPYVDVGRMLRFSLDTTRWAAHNARMMLRELLSGRKAH